MFDQHLPGWANEPEVLVDRLRLPTLVLPVFGMCLGWPDQETEVKPRLPTALVLHQDRYTDPQAAQIQGYDHEEYTHLAAARDDLISARASLDDQQRVMTPLDALNGGADMLVIGRPITAAPDPLESLCRIRDEIALFEPY